MRESPLTVPEGATLCPSCGAEGIILTTRITPAAWVLVAAGVIFAPFTAGMSLVFPAAAVLLREPRWRCEHCWKHGMVSGNHTVKPAWSHLRRH